jgi:LacI family transcriptional regulator
VQQVIAVHVTLQDVARLAKVSSKTVSRVVNNQGEISESTRRRVQQAIEQLGYRPNFLARSLVSQRSSTLGVVASGLNYYGPSSTLTGIEQQTYDLGYSLLFSLLPHSDETNVFPILDSFVARRVDGIIWAVSEIGNNRAWIQPEALKDLPPIVFLTMEPKPGLSVVVVDNKSGAIKATQHLIDLGKRNIGVITGPMVWWEARERTAGYMEMMQKANLTVIPAQVAEGDWTASGGKKAMKELLEQYPQMDAVFACNDEMALGALGVAHQLGIEIPQDIAFVGFDNMPESDCFWPPLSTVEQHLFDVGAISVQILQKLIKARQQGQEDLNTEVRLLEAELVIRESSIGLPSGESLKSVEPNFLKVNSPD